MAGTNAELKDLLKCTLEDMYGVRVWYSRDLPDIFQIRAGGSEATVSRREIEEVQMSCKDFIDLLKNKLGL